MDLVVDPRSGRITEKYGKHWYYLLRSGFTEDELEALPVINKKIYPVTYVNQLDLNTYRPGRGGVVLYTVYKGNLMFGLGLDAKYNELTDFGGGIQYGYDKNAINGALREFCEETLDLYCLRNADDIQNAVVLKDPTNFIIFVYTDENPDDITMAFQKAYQESKNKKKEIKDIVWVTEKELKSALKLNMTYIYSRLRNFLSKFGDFYRYL